MTETHNIPSAHGPRQFTDMLMRTCPLCDGTGLNPKLPTYVCPKCHGEKKVPR
jgi:DnaJ-class molecular chaperone